MKLRTWIAAQIVSNMAIKYYDIPETVKKALEYTDELLKICGENPDEQVKVADLPSAFDPMARFKPE